VKEVEMNFIEIMGRMFDNKTRRPVRVDESGHLQVDIRKPATIKTVTVTKALAGGTYIAQDVLSESATEGLGNTWDFADLVRKPGGSAVIVQASVESESEDIVPRLSLYPYTKLPTCNLADNVPHIGPTPEDKAFFVGVPIDFIALEDTANATGDSYSSATISTVGNLPIYFTCENNSTTLHCVLVTRDGFTQTATDDLTVKLTVLQY